MGGGRGDRLGRVDEAFDHLVDGEVLLVPATLYEMGLDPVEEIAQTQGLSPPFRSC